MCGAHTGDFYRTKTCKSKQLNHKFLITSKKLRRTQRWLLPQNKIHKQIIEGWEDLGCAIGSSLNKLVIISSIHKLISNDFELAKNISKKGQRIVDGLGAKRISQEILKFHGICKWLYQIIFKDCIVIQK